VVIPILGNFRSSGYWQERVEGFERACTHLGAEPVLQATLSEDRAAARLHRLHDAILPTVEWSDVVITHWPYDANQVHRTVARAVELATRPFRRRRDVLLFETASSTEQGFANTFSPNLYVLVEEAHMRQKCAAMQCYAGEYAPGRRPEDLLAKAKVRGAEVDAPYAEAFVVARQFL
jgi:LmbE family N-acetylglucosaminyl deacetylase